MSKNLRKSPLLDALQARKDPFESGRARTSMVLSARIAGALKAKGWNKGQLAKALGKSPSMVTRWLSGTHNFTSDTLSDIEQVLPVRLLTRTEEEQRVVTADYSILAFDFQRKMSASAYLSQMTLSGGCTTTRFYTATADRDREPKKTLASLKQG